MKQTRIIKRTMPSGRITYTIQQKHWLFRWRWVDASWNSAHDYCIDTFDSEEQAIAKLYLFNGAKTIEEVVSG